MIKDEYVIEELGDSKPGVYLYLTIDDDRAVDWSSQQGVAQAVKINFQGGSWVADGNPLVGQSGEGLLGQFDDLGEGDDLADLNFRLLLVDVDDLDLAISGSLARLKNASKLLFFSLDGGTC